MSHDDETTPSWQTEVSFERSPDGEADSWEQQLAQWRGAETPSETPPAPAPAQPPGAALDHSWLTEPLEEISLPAQPTPQPVPEPPPTPVVVQEPVVPAPVVELPEPIVEPAPPAAVVEPEPEVEETVELPAEESEPAPKVPFYKREISLKRTPKPKEPKAEKKPKPKAEKPPRERKPKRERTTKAEAPAEAKVPFYRRDLSFKRAKPDRAPADETAPKPERTKRERPKLRRPSLPRPELGGGGKNSKRLVGLKIGASQIAAARVSNDDSPQLLQAVSSPLEHGVVVGGELRDPEALAEALREFFKRHNLPRKGVRLGIANNRIGVRTLDVVGIEDPRQLDNAIKFRAQEVLPIPLADAVLDYQVLSESVDEEGQPFRRVLLVVAYRDLVDRYVDACRKAGLELVGIDLEAFALLRALTEPSSEFQPLPGVERAATVAVAIGHERSTFAISDGRVCEFTRVLEWGGWSLNVAIARALDTSPSEAEDVKRALSFRVPGEPPQGFGQEQLATALEAARAQLQTFARELVSSLQFYQGQPGSLGIGEIVLTGGTSHLDGLAAELERLVGVPVRVGDPLGRLKLGKGVGELDQVGSLAVAIGLGIED
jgi:type IV pilus assembly protein PilM